MNRTILHCDMNGFFASVELLAYPEYKNVPMAVCGNPENRHGIILAKNEIAKKYKIKTAETLWQAKKKCPHLVCVPPHMSKYKHYSKLINEIYRRFTDIVEPFSIDESWLDVTNSIKLFGDGKIIADTIRKTVREELGLTLSAGVSYNKIFAKMGSDYKKPDATTVITKENFKKTLWPLPVGNLFFVGHVTETKLNKYGIYTIGDLANTQREFLSSSLGKQGNMLYIYANGLDESPVSPDWERQRIKSVGHGITFKRNLVGEEDIKTAVIGLSDKIASRMRNYQLKASGIKVEIKDITFQTVSRQKQLLKPSNLTKIISAQAMNIIRDSWDFEKPIRLLTITAINLVDENESEQLNFFFSDNMQIEKSEKVEFTMDEIRKKFGNKAISFGRVINNDIGIDISTYNDE